MKKIVLIDGNSLINRAYFALPPLNNAQGEPVHAVYGFATMLVKTVETVQPDCIVVAFDRHEPTFRHKMYDGYKAHRKHMPDDLLSQMPILKDMLDAMGITHVELGGYEADDLIGTLAKRFDARTYIVTGDRDSFQLVDETTSVLYTKRGITETEEITVESLQSLYSLTPQGVIEYKALAGDSSDEIPGVAGVGDKTAKSLLAQYNNVEGVYAHIDELPAALATKLRNGKKNADLSKTLATIDTNVPLPLTLEECAFTFPFGKETFAFFEKQGFKTLLRRADLFSVGDDAPVSERRNAETVMLSSLQAVTEKLSGANEAAFWQSERALHFAVDTNTEYVVELAVDLLTAGVREGELFAAISPFLTDPNKLKIVFDSKQFNAGLKKDYRISPVRLFDVKLAQYLADAGIAHEELKEFADYYGIPDSAYASGLLYAKTLLEKELAEAGMERLYYDIELPLVGVLADMEETGVAVNRSKLEEIGQKFTLEEKELQEKIYAAAGQSFNIKSPRQLAKVLFEDLAISYPKKGAKTYNTNAEILEQIEGAHEVVPLVLRYRLITKLNSTYIDGLKKLLDAHGAVHTEFKQTLTTTGRLSSVEPNLQNIPVRTDDGKQLRSLFEAREGYTLISADYSQIELRLMAHLSNDKAMVAAYQTGEDVHAYTASQVFGIPLEQVTEKERRAAKAVNFGIIYGISDFGLAADLKISRGEAKEYIDNYFARFAGVRAYLDDCVANAKKTGYVSTIFGRRRKIPELFSSMYVTRQFGERAAMNMPLQGSAADIIKIAMLRVSEALRGKRSRLILQIHDELIIEAAEEEKEEVKAMLKDRMENAVTLSVPLVVSVGEGKSWFDCK
ncbi:MAG: DNA polymerase I [Clostridiales bacterium]|nr:DNA polymerase I [Clostridiales bacterium]